MYELFVGPPEMDAEWDDRGIDGVRRFLGRFWNLVTENADKNFAETAETVKIRHKLVYDITTRLENFNLNTVVSAALWNILTSLLIYQRSRWYDKATLETAVTLLAPFAPHLQRTLGNSLDIIARICRKSILSA